MCWSGTSRYLRDPRLARDDVEELVGEGGRVGVVQADPLAAPRPAASSASSAKRGAPRLLGAGEVGPVRGEVLRDQVDLTGATRRPAPATSRTTDVGSAAALRAAQLGDDAERARPIAALGDLHVGAVARPASGARGASRRRGKRGVSTTLSRSASPSRPRRSRRPRRCRGSDRPRASRSTAPSGSAATGSRSRPGGGRSPRPCGRAISRMVSIDSSLASPMKPQVLTTMTSASSGAATSS